MAKEERMPNGSRCEMIAEVGRETGTEYPCTKPAVLKNGELATCLDCARKLHAEGDILTKNAEAELEAIENSMPGFRYFRWRTMLRSPVWPIDRHWYGMLGMLVCGPQPEAAQ